MALEESAFGAGAEDDEDDLVPSSATAGLLAILQGRNFEGLAAERTMVVEEDLEVDELDVEEEAPPY